jgi:hypothetical protein
MIIAETESLIRDNDIPLPRAKFRRQSEGEDPTILADIYLEETNIVIWRRKLPATFSQSIESFLDLNSELQVAMVVTPETAYSLIHEKLADSGQHELCKNIDQLVGIFCSLLEVQRVGLRLANLDRAMCPKFHVDKVPCRMVTTFQGLATEWLPHESVNREKLGLGSIGKNDSQSGIFNSKEEIQHLHSGDVALLKGEMWEDNENAGLVHRSPALSAGQRRLILTLDMIQ